MEANDRPRKACDLCYTRKIKCDGQEPRCSNCISYDTSCTHTVLSRKSKPKAQRNGRAKETDEVQSLRTLVQRLKAQLRRVQEKVQDHPQELKQPPVITGRLEDGPASDQNDAIGSMTLPPLQQALPMVHAFLNNFNSVLPLFHADTLLRLVGECYALSPPQRDPVVWAAINVVLALATFSEHAPPVGNRSTIRPGNVHTTEYLNKAQSVLSTVMLGEMGLLRIQTLVGMVMVLQSSHDVTPSLILISATMRLAHKMSLHNRAASAHLDPVERQQRANVFWLAYILDKDLSLRAHQPSVQLDDDIDLNLPSSSQTDAERQVNTAGVIMAGSGNSSMSYFLARVQLANIEGSLYDCLYSTRALNRSPEERSKARDSIVNALEEWQASIPPEFSAAIVVSSTNNNPAHINFFCLLYSTHLQCMTLINRAHAWDQQWISDLRDHGEGTQALQLPLGWGSLVHQARDFMVLLGEVWSKDIWFRCQLVDAALLWLNNVPKEVQSEQVWDVRDVCAEAIRQVRWKHAEAIGLVSGNRLFLELSQ
ncbi:fungal transcription factor regulatory middle homology region [Fusarium albosuccineum]|uniref:Fungal transcription factor regulatory middle homology region n=1 Tax=Fusarium albosuccineum TaxID=1237068 RepID=A0A8H4PB69_9HYPO|nr:fungal transcription factor regulatory middle homology region [Fusarium albosuccineum]